MIGRPKLDRFREFLLELEPRETITRLVLELLVTTPENRIKDLGPGQAILEYVAGIYLSWPLSTSYRKPTMDDLARIKQETMNIVDTYMYESIENTSKLKGQEDVMKERISFFTRLYYLILRGEAYPNQLLRAAQEEFSPHNGFLKRKLGFDIETAISIFARLDNTIEKQLNSFIEEYVSILSEADESRKNSSEREISIGQMLEMAKHIRNDEVRSKLEKHEAKLSDILTIAIDEIGQDVGRDIIKNFLNRFASQFGQINKEFKEPLDFNELNAKPITLLDSNKIFVPVPTLLSQVPVRTLYYDLVTDHSYEPIYSKIKGEYHEGKTVEYLSRIFTPKCIHHNLRYGKNKEFQTDVLVTFDDKIVIVECKSKELTLPARQGSYCSIMDDVKKGIKDGFEQAKRTKDYILSNDVAKFENSTGNIVEIKKDCVSKIYLVCITSQSFAGLVTSQALLLKDASEDFPWVAGLFDLELISEYLSNPYFFLHFLKQRIQNRENVISADEMDYVGCYLSRGLGFEEELKSGKAVYIVNFTDQFDYDQLKKMGYELSAKVGDSWSNPAFSNLVGSIAKLGGKGHSNMIEVLLDLSNELRDLLLTSIRDSIIKTQTDGRRHDYTISLDKPWNFGISFVSMLGRKELQDTNAQLSVIKKYKHKKDTWLGLG